MSTDWRRCETCEFIGPDLSPFRTDALAFHRAGHHLERLILETLRIPEMALWLARALES